MSGHLAEPRSALGPVADLVERTRLASGVPLVPTDPAALAATAALLAPKREVGQ